MTPEQYNADQISAGKLTLEHITKLVKAWQAAHGLEVDGMAGPLTLASILPAPFKLAWPMPVLSDGRHAEITSGFRPADRLNHDGCDFFYRWKPGDKPDLVGDGGCEGKNSDGTPRWVVPYGTFALAAAPGIVQVSKNTPTGWCVWIDHGNGLRTGYFHLSGAFCSLGSVMEAGDQVGTVGHNPSDQDGRHLHFELSPVDRYAPMNPEPYLTKP